MDSFIENELILGSQLPQLSLSESISFTPLPLPPRMRPAKSS